MSVTDRVAQHRRRLRAAGLRPVRFWVPDVRLPSFAQEAARQSRSAAESDRAEGVMDWVEAMTADVWSDE